MKNRVRLQISFFVVFILVGMAIPKIALGQPSIVMDGSKQFQFAEDYFEKGEYYRAIGEYQRFVHFFPQNSRAELAKYMIGLSYLKGEKLQEAALSFIGLIGEYHDTELSMKSYLRLSECYNRLKQPDKALSALEMLLQATQNCDLKDEALYRQGWIYLEMEEWPKAEASFDQISPENRDGYGLKALSDDLNKRECLKGKNPTTAGWLAVVPGAGHAYCERYQDALIAFLLNGAMMWAAYEAFDNGNEALGGLITVFEIGLYGGNIYSAVNSAHKYNRKQKQDFLRYLKEHSKFEASTGAAAREGRALALSCKIAF